MVTYDAKEGTIAKEGDSRVFRVGGVIEHFKRETVSPSSDYCLYRILTVAEEYKSGRLLVVYEELGGKKRVFARSIDGLFAEVDKNRYPRISRKEKFVPVDETKAIWKPED